MDWINIAVATGLVVLCLFVFASPAFAANAFTGLVIGVALLLAIGALAATVAGGGRSKPRT